MKRICSVLRVLFLWSVVVGCAKPSNDAGTLNIDGNRLSGLSQIGFETNSDVILEESTTVLDYVVSILRDTPRITAVRIEGHTDVRGDNLDNLQLSELRASAVERYLREHGVRQPIESEGFGESRLLCQESTQECHSQNRRVDFMVKIAPQ